MSDTQNLMLVPLVQYELPRIDDVLPRNISSRSYRCNGVEVREGYPYGQKRVLLSEALATAHCIAEMMSDPASCSELQYADHKRTQSEKNHSHGRTGSEPVYGKTHATPNHYEERNSPNIERKLLPPNQPGMSLRNKPLHAQCGNDGQDQQRKDVAAYYEKALQE